MSEAIAGERDVKGFTAPGLEPVREEFERNFTEREELGAAFAAYLDGELVIDLWGGCAHPATDGPGTGRAWQADTLQLIFSGTKGLVATCLLLLIERGQLRLEDRVCEHWPEFAANGKQHVTVAEVVSHRARLPAIATPLTASEIYDDRRMASLLASQAQEQDPRAKATYHPLTYGWLCGELIRRIDGRSVGAFFSEEIATPLGMEVWIGLPQRLEERVSTLVHGKDWDANPLFDEQRPDDLAARIWNNPPDDEGDSTPYNNREFHAAEIPGANAIGTARSIARLYGALARGGEIDGKRLLAPETIALGQRELCRFIDPFSGEELVYGAGFELQAEMKRLGPPARVFGHSGAGGSIHAAWPELRVGVSYAMNEMRDDLHGDPRSQSLLRALYEALA
jgi:CubicO group peptidase (beta-lactamase class C family)